MNRILPITLILLGGLVVGDSHAAPPNIVLVLVDDLGWSDLHCQGNARVDTPRIDRLAAEGVRFTDAYAAAPVCSPTRAATMTGLTPARLRITNHIPDRPNFARKDAPFVSAETRDHLPEGTVTIADRLKEAGYATGFFGKWHLAGRDKGPGGQGDPKFYPERHGFDVNVGGCTLGGPPTYFDPYRIHNLPSRKEGEYLPDRLVDETLAFVREHRDQPFFVSLWNYTVHWPMEAPAELVKKYEPRKGPGVKDPRYAAMTEALDNAIGRLLDGLDELGKTDDTLFVFTSDNGGFSGVADNRPLRDGKGDLYEGGIRVPMIVRWPEVVEPGRTNNVPVVSMDLFPTFLAAAGLKPSERPLDGVSLLPLLRGESLADRDLYFHYPNYAWHGGNRLGSAVRSGRYKLIERFDGGTELFDLAADLSERTNLADREPEVAERLRTRLRKWLEETDAATPERRVAETP